MIIFRRYFSCNTLDRLMAKPGGLGPIGLDSDWMPENERDWDS